MMRRWFIALLMLPFATMAEVDSVTHYLATVDSATQKIMLSWSPSATADVQGYYICSDTIIDFCRNNDTVRGGRTDTVYTFYNHNPLKRHFYAIRAYDEEEKVSSQTVRFGTMILQANIPPCALGVNATWTPYVGMPSGVDFYRLVISQDNHSDNDTVYSGTDTSFSFEMRPDATEVRLHVEAVSTDGLLTSWSNIVHVERRTTDTASHLAVTEISYDSNTNNILLTFDLDDSWTTTPYRLWRRIDDASWRELAVLDPHATSYTDLNINPYNDHFCYRLSVTDACDMNPRYTEPTCVEVPTPPQPAVALPNVIIAGDERNGTFLPATRGLDGLYELYVYNRWGSLVFHTTDPTQGWTPDSDIPQGAYAYLLRCRFNTGYIQSYSGTVTIIK